MQEYLLHALPDQGEHDGWVYLGTVSAESPQEAPTELKQMAEEGDMPLEVKYILDHSSEFMAYPRSETTEFTLEGRVPMEHDD